MFKLKSTKVNSPNWLQRKLNCYREGKRREGKSWLHIFRRNKPKQDFEKLSQGDHIDVENQNEDIDSPCKVNNRIYENRFCLQYWLRWFYPTVPKRTSPKKGKKLWSNVLSTKSGILSQPEAHRSCKYRMIKTQRKPGKPFLMTINNLLNGSLREIDHPTEDQSKSEAAEDYYSETPPSFNRKPSHIFNISPSPSKTDKEIEYIRKEKRWFHYFVWNSGLNDKKIKMRSKPQASFSHIDESLQFEQAALREARNQWYAHSRKPLHRSSSLIQAAFAKSSSIENKQDNAEDIKVQPSIEDEKNLLNFSEDSNQSTQKKYDSLFQLEQLFQVGNGQTSTL